MPGRPYKPGLTQTYDGDIGYSDRAGDKINDGEDINMRSQTAASDGKYPLDQLWTNGNANPQDWAQPGKNSKDPY
jgi:hypothetical protein